MNQKQDSIKEMLDLLKGDYNFPVKLWVWGKVIKEWAGIVIGSAIFFLVALFIILSIKGAGSNVELQPAEVLTAHLKEIAKFIKTNSESVTKRQEIIEKLTEEISLYAGRALDQAQLESKLKSFSYLLSTCNEYRGSYRNTFANNINPFDDPNISHAFDELVVGHFFIGRHVLDPQEENKRWESLCAFCRQEANKANDELAQILKAGNAQATEKTEGSENEDFDLQVKHFKF